MELSWYSLIPPIITLTLAFATRHILISLGAGIVASGLIISHGNLYQTITTVFTRFIETTEIQSLWHWDRLLTSDKLHMFIFLTFLGIVITLMSHAGGVYAFGRFFRSRITNKRGAETASLMLSSTLFIDDYFSLLAVGSVMRPLTDGYRIPRVKLAFLIDSVAVPLCALAPISSWGAAIVMQLGSAGISDQLSNNPLIIGDPFSVYLHMFLYNFHTIFLLCGVWFIVRRNISFGLMGEHEAVAVQTGNLFNGKEPREQRLCDVGNNNQETARLTDFTIPIVTLFVSVIGFMLYTGGYHLLGGTRSLFMTFNYAQSALSLCAGAMITLIVTLALYTLNGRVRRNDLGQLIVQGSLVMWSSIQLLVLAWTLSSFLRNDLQTGNYLAQLLPADASPALLPPLFMICAAVIAFAIGSAWGTMAILFPIALPLLTSLLGITTPAMASDVTLLYPTLAAILSGAVLGDHISPIADVTVMASSSAGAYHLDYIYAQFGYALPIALGSLAAFIVAGFTSSYGLLVSSGAGFVVGLSIALGLLELLNRMSTRS